MVQIEDKDYAIKIIRLVAGVCAGLFLFHISDFLLVYLFDFIDNNFFSARGRFGLLQQIIYTIFLLMASAVCILASTLIANEYKSAAAQVTSICLGLWIGILLWWLSFPLWLICSAMVINYLFSLIIATRSSYILSLIKKRID